MDPNVYQAACARTECDQAAALQRIAGVPQPRPHRPLKEVRALHAALGAAKEAGELAGLAEDWLWYGQKLDPVRVASEIGDVLWYLALLCNATGLSLATCMEANLAKLRERYAEGYDPAKAERANRDRPAEAKAVSDGLNPLSEGLQEVPSEIQKRVRRRSEVLAARRTIVGCCDRFADRQPCDCYEQAIPDDSARVQDGHGFGHASDAPA